MIADRTTDVTVDSTLDGEKIAMGIDTSALAHIMSVLTDLYSDPEMACIREYSTNARDAHIEAGVTRPIEVTTPSTLSPYLRIKDYGIGLTVEDIRNIYSRYGASTKRDTNDQVGMLGLGCKSALTYSSQFTLVSVKDGTLSQVSVSRDADGAGSMTVMEPTATDKPNGTEVVIPAKTNNSIDRKAQDFFQYWPAGSVLVNGREPEPMEGLWVSDNYLVRNNSYQDYIVMGGVAYPASLEVGVSYGHSVVAFVNIGDVVFTPSREALQMVPKTRDTIERIQLDFKAKVVGAVQRVIDAAETHREALLLKNQWEPVLPREARSDQYRFNGMELPERFMFPEDNKACVIPGKRHHKYSQHQWTTAILSPVAAEAIWVHSYTPETFTAGQKKKIMKWMDENNYGDVEQLILHTDKPKDTTWINPEKIVDWAEIKAIKLPRAARTHSGRLAGSFDVYTQDSPYSTQTDANNIDTSKPLFWVGLNSSHNYYKILAENYDEFSMVRVPKNRQAKFCRDFPEAIHGEKAATTLFKKWTRSLTQQQRAAMAMSRAMYYGERNALLRLDINRVNDPDLKAAIRLAGINLTKTLEQLSMFQTVLSAASIETDAWTNPMDKYPLYSSQVLLNNPTHVYHYLNSAYAAEKGA